MKNMFALALLLLLTNRIHAQSLSDTIEIKKIHGTVFLQHGEKLTPRKLLQISSANAEAQDLMRTAKTYNDIGNIISFTGGFLIGYPVGTAIVGGQPEWRLAAVGVFLGALSIFFTSNYANHAKLAVRIYNSHLKKSETNTGESGLGENGKLGASY